MTQFYFPFTSIDGDRRYNAKDFATYFHSIFTDGVIATVKDKLRVSQSEATGMHVVVNTGAAFIHGHLYLLGEPMTVDVTPGNSTGDRVDSIVLQLDHLERDMKILYKQNSTNVQRDENYWELQIATINVPRNATQVLNGQINDMRASEDVAGYSKLQGNLDVEGMEQHYESLLQQLSSDMTAWVSDKKIDFQGDWDAWFTTTQNTLEQLVTDMQGWTDDKQLEFQTDWDTWFATVQGALDGDTAGNLLSKINAHELKEATETELGHVRLSDIPIPTKESIGLGNVDNVKQASKVEHDQLASDFNEHQEDDVSQGEIHGLRVNNEKLEYYTGAEWKIASGGIPVGNVNNLNIEQQVGNKLALTWSDPVDKLLDEVVIAEWKGTKVIRKTGSYPFDVNDGTEIADVTARDKHKSSALVDSGLSTNTKYYYMLFPYTDEIETVDSANRASKEAVSKFVQPAPPAPVISELEFDRATVTGGDLVSLDKVTWHNSPYTFTGLTEETSYTAYAKRKETDEFMESDISPGNAFKTPAELQLYGFEIDETNSNPKTAVTYIEDAIGMTPASGNDGNFNWGSWEPFIKEISKPVVMKAGVDQYDLNYDDYTKKATGGNSILTGADGDVFTKLQHLHMKYEKITNGHRWLLASKPFDGSFSMTEELEDGYNQFNNPILVTLQNLYLLIFKDRDAQTALGRGRVDGAGYIESGNTNSKGYMFGSAQDLQMKFLGIEDFWGNKLQWVDGLMSDSNRDILHGTGNFNDTGSGYTKQTTAVSADINGYHMKVQGGKGGYVPADSSASETTGYADYGYLKASRLASFGGSRGVGGFAGAFYVRSDYSASHSAAAISARLCYKNADAVYIGAYLGFEQSGKLRSISGNMPTDTKTISQFRTLAKANN